MLCHEGRLKFVTSGRFVDHISGARWALIDIGSFKRLRFRTVELEGLRLRDPFLRLGLVELLLELVLQSLELLAGLGVVDHRSE